jgi:ATP-binding cassette subfamily F protein 3
MTQTELGSALRELARVRSGSEPIVSLHLDVRWTDEHQRERVRLFVQEAIRRALAQYRDGSPGREALERTLKNFEGTILCVSHDRYFLNRVCRRLLVLHPPAMVDFAGNYEQWPQRQREQLAEARQQKENEARRTRPAEEKPRAAAPNKKNPYLRPFGRLSVEQLEAEIHNAEQCILDCETDFADPETFKDPGKAKELQEEYDGLKQRLAQLEEEYFSREE